MNKVHFRGFHFLIYSEMAKFEGKHTFASIVSHLYKICFVLHQGIRNSTISVQYQ